MESLYWFLDQTHIVVTGITGLSFLLTRSPHVAYFIVGALACNTFAKLSKRVIRQDRPYTTVPAASSASPSPSPPPPPSSSSSSPRHPKKVKKTYGMPSTHSTSIAFFMTYIMLSLPPFQRSLTHSALADGAMLVGTLVWGGAIMWSRVYLGYHTRDQVLVGGLIGLVGGIVWRATWDGYVVPNGLERGMQHVVDQAFALVGR